MAMRYLLSILMIFAVSGCRTPRAPRTQQAYAPKPAPVPVEQQKRIFLVIDDAGLDLNEARQFLDLPIPMTIAVLPHLKMTPEVCDAIRRRPDKEIILHQPMEAYDANSLTGPGAIRNATRPADVRLILDKNLKSVRGAVGINNHMGSRVTENEILVTEILRYCRAHRLYFLDSKTAYNTQVPRVARQENMHLESRHVFLDVQQDRDTVRKAWESTVRKARENGYVIAIGHIWSDETATAIRDSYETLINQGYSFHVLSELYP